MTNQPRTRCLRRCSPQAAQPTSHPRYTVPSRVSNPYHFEGPSTIARRAVSGFRNVFCFCVKVNNIYTGLRGGYVIATTSTEAKASFMPASLELRPHAPAASTGPRPPLVPGLHCPYPGGPRTPLAYHWRQAHAPSVTREAPSSPTPLLLGFLPPPPSPPPLYPGWLARGASLTPASRGGKRVIGCHAPS